MGKSRTFALAKPRGVRSYGAPAEVGAEAMRGKEISGSLAGMKIFRTFALTSPPEGAGDAEKRDHRHKDKTRASPFLEIRSERCELCKYKTRKQVVYQFSRWDSSVTSSET